MNLERLSQPLDASRVKTREGSGGRQLSYLETHDVIRAANDIFGFGGWGHEIVELRRIDSITVHDQSNPPRPGVMVGYLCIVKLTTVTGEGHSSGVGYGDAREYGETATVTAHELAAKEAESDALKRALKNYGDQFGLALYDKQSATAGHVTGPSAPSQARTEAPTASREGYRLTFGKHAGKLLGEVDDGYLVWYLREGKNEDVKAQIIAFRGGGVTEPGEQGFDVPPLTDDDIPF